MYTVALFTSSGVVLYNRSAVKEKVPLAVFNDAIAAHIRGSQYNGPSYQVKIVENHQLRVSCAVAYPSVVSVQSPDALAQDLLKVYEGLHADSEIDLQKFSELADLRLASASIAAGASSSGASASSTDPAGTTGSTSAPSSAPASSSVTPRAATPKPKKSAKKTKENRKWDGQADDSIVLDYSEPPTGQDLGATDQEPLTADTQDLGERTALGFEVKALEHELNSLLSKEAEEPQKRSRFGFIQNYVGGKKLTDADLDKALSKMEDQLVTKNVTKDIAHDICQEVRRDLLGVTTSSWTSVNASVQASMSRILAKTLTPNSSNDLLLEIKQAKAKKQLYVMSIVGVNGVGKSTNLGKIAFWLLQNNFKVLIAACDTFRSGAVEQLGVHVKRLQQLTERQEAGTVELFDQGYGKDAAVIAKKAREYGEKNGFDIVLIDTAGRRHNDQRLMSSLEKFGKFANPDKIIMVGEALVGTDSVQQALNFNAAFGHERNIDFFLISKCDTVGEMLGTLVNMTSSTGIPVLFVGVGQNYTDLRTLSVDWAVNLLLS